MSTENTQKSIVTASGHMYAAHGVQVTSKLFIAIILVNNLTVEDYGLYNFIISCLMFALMVSNLGLTQAIQKYLPEYIQKRDTNLQKALIKTTFVARLGGCLVFVAALWFARSIIINNFNLPGTFLKLLPLICATVVFFAQSQLLGEGILLATFKNRYWNYVKVVYSVLNVTGYYLSLQLGFGLTGIIFWLSFCEALQFVLYILKIQKTFDLTSIKSVSSIPIKKWFNFSKYLVLSNTTYFLRDKAADIFVISYFFSQKEVGLYSFAYGIPMAFMSFSPASKLRGILIPYLSFSHTETNSSDQIQFFFSLLNKIIFFVMVPAFLLAIMLSEEIIFHVFDPDYLKVKTIFQLSLAFLCVQQFAYVFIPVIYVLEKTNIQFMTSLFAFYNLGMDLVLVPKFGIIGAVIATGSAGAILPVFYYLIVKRHVFLQYPWKSFMVFSINLIPVVIITYLVHDKIGSIWYLVLYIALIGFSYMCLSYFNNGFEKDEKQFIRDRFRLKFIK